jgi:hypothetical protein
MDAVRQIERLLLAYADAVDGGDFAAVGAMLRHGRICAASPDGDAARDTVIAEGAEAIEAFYRSLVRLYDDGTPRTRHVTTNVVVEIDEAAGTATGAATFTVFQATDTLPLQAICVGRYRDTYRRVEGEWLFGSRAMTMDLKGDLSQHLLFPMV